MAAGTSSSSCWVGLQPLKSTFPFQLQSRRNGDGDRAASVPCAAGPAEKASWIRPPRVPHTSSLDTILGSYLMGQWPRDAEGLPLSHMSDKSTQTPVSWHESEVGKVADHKRSASWNNMDHRREIAKLKQQLQRTKLAVWNSKEKNQSFSTQCNHSMVPSTKASPLASFPVLTPVSISPSLHNSFDSINQELEEVFVKEQGDMELVRILDVPDGHRAPLPFQRRTEDSLLPRLENNSSPCSSLSFSPSPTTDLPQSPHSPAEITEEVLPGALDKLVLEDKDRENGSTSPILAFALSPRPNHTYVFKREPPEGCEKIHASEEVVYMIPVPGDGRDSEAHKAGLPPGLRICLHWLPEALPKRISISQKCVNSEPQSLQPSQLLSISDFFIRRDQPVLPSCPDKNKVYFNPKGSAFCQFSLVKPLIPKVNMLFRNFSSSPSPKSSDTFSSCQATTTVPILTLQKDLRGDDFSENPKSPSLGLESWKRHQPEDTALFHSSVAV